MSINQPIECHTVYTTALRTYWTLTSWVSHCKHDINRDLRWWCRVVRRKKDFDKVQYFITKVKFLFSHIQNFDLHFESHVSQSSYKYTITFALSTCRSAWFTIQVTPFTRICLVLHMCSLLPLLSVHPWTSFMLVMNNPGDTVDKTFSGTKWKTNL